MSLLVATAGFGWEMARFGPTEAATTARIEREVRRLVADRTRQLSVLASRVAREDALIAEASGSRDRLPALFNRLEIARPVGAAGPSVTVYVPSGPAGTYRVLAWSDGPAEDLREDPLQGPRAIFLAPGTVGLRLIALQPVETGDRRVGVVSAEAILAPSPGAGPTPGGYRLETSIGPVRVIPQFAGGGEEGSQAPRFVISAEDGKTLLEARFLPDEIRQYRHGFRTRVFVLAAVPLLLLPIMATARTLERRRRTAAIGQWSGWSLLATMIVAGTAAVVAAALWLIDTPRNVLLLVAGMAAVIVAGIWPVSLWWRRGRRLSPVQRPLRFLTELVIGGALLAAALTGVTIMLRRGIASANLERWQLPLMPMDSAGLIDLAAVLLAQTAIGWGIATALATFAVRWHLHWRRVAAVIAAMVWIAPLAILLLSRDSPVPIPLPGAGAIAAASVAILFALLAGPLRRYYRRTSEAMRLVLLFTALVLPAVAVYPIAAESATDTARTLIEERYGPATAGHSDRLLDEIAKVEREIDRIPGLQDYVLASRPADGGIPSQLAFQIWNQTSLARQRLTSQIELYGPDRLVVSRFALNVPEFESLLDAATPPSTVTSCRWEDWSETARIGAEERSMIHSERAICDASGNIRGAVVVRLVPDYRDLPFIASASPYFNVVGGGAQRPGDASRVQDLQVVVYGWSLRPTFTSGSVAWGIPDEIFQRLYHSRTPFWTTLSAANRPFHVYFMNDRAGVYALGYPPPTVFQHLTRIAEIVVVAGMLFVLLLVGSAVYAGFSKRGEAPLRALYREIRTSFYRKLFLFFVMAAIGPVLLFALAFGAYMTGRFSEDVEAEASNVVTVARRVLEELAAAQQHPDQRQAAPPDDVMVWIRQVVDQEVNLFDGPYLVATSQRDLFDSGLLPTRTPAAVYRAIALNRLPVLVETDELGSFRYLVAAAPVRSFGRDVVLTVPLATRQREIDAQIDELNRGVLVGAVVVVLFAAGLGASVAGRVSDPVARLTRATRLIAAGRLDVRLVADTADELGRLVEDFNSMARTLVANREELARSNQLQAWAEMARQVAHEIKNPLTPIQLAAEHLQRVHEDQNRPLGAVFDQCLSTVLGQVRLLRRIASEFSNFAGQPTPRFAPADVAAIVESVVGPYRLGVSDRITITVSLPPDLPAVHVDRTLIARAFTNLVENAVQAMASGGTLLVSGRRVPDGVELTFADTGPGMDAEGVRRAFEPYFSTKTAGSGLGLANARRHIELCHGTIQLSSTEGAGTTVTVTLPTAAPPGGAEDGSPPDR